MFAFGLADDRWNITPRWQHLIHAAAGIAIVFLIFVEYFYSPLNDDKITFPLWFTVVFTLFWIMGMVNTVNWLDGVNGLAAGVTAIACAVLFINTAFRLDPPQTSVSLLPLALPGTCLFPCWL